MPLKTDYSVLSKMTSSHNYHGSHQTDPPIPHHGCERMKVVECWVTCAISHWVLRMILWSRTTVHLLISLPSTDLTRVVFNQTRDNSTLAYRHVLVRDIYTRDPYSCDDPEGDHTAHSPRETYFGRHCFSICLNSVKYNSLLCHGLPWIGYLI